MILFYETLGELWDLISPKNLQTSGTWACERADKKRSGPAWVAGKDQRWLSNVGLATKCASFSILVMTSFLIHK